MDARIRKAEIELTTLGSGVIAFGAWTFIKTALNYIFIGFDAVEDQDEITKTTVVILTWVIIAVDLLVRVYVGFSARAEGRNKRRKTPLYIILAGGVLFFTVIIALAEIVMLVLMTGGLLNLLVNIIIDITSGVMLLELMINAVRVRRYRKEVQKEVRDER